MSEEVTSNQEAPEESNEPSLQDLIYVKSGLPGSHADHLVVVNVVQELMALLLESGIITKDQADGVLERSAERANLWRRDVEASTSTKGDPELRREAHEQIAEAIEKRIEHFRAKIYRT